MSFEELQSVDIRTVRPEDVVDIRQIKIEEGLSQQEKRREFIRQVKNPYCFRVGNVIVKASYSGNGVSLNERTNVSTKTERYETNVKNVFTAGDMHRGQSLVVWAIREGREAAKAVDESLMGYTNLK